jgi:hypothetical protein
MFQNIVGKPISENRFLNQKIENNPFKVKFFLSTGRIEYLTMRIYADLKKVK